MRVKLSENVFADVEGGDVLIEDENGDFYLTPREAYRLMELYIHVLTDEEWEHLKEIQRSAAEQRS